jgi:hypothetical protein
VENKMDEKQMQDFLEDVLLDSDEVDGIGTFRDEGVMTRNKGLVVKMSDGTEFQLTIVKSN